MRKPDRGSSVNRGWESPENLPDHVGRPLKGSRDFVAPPPAEIGEVISAWSTVRSGQIAWSMLLRAAWFMLLGLVAWLLVELLAMLAAQRAGWTLQPERKMQVLALAEGIVLMIAGCSRWRHRCTFVGRDGIAELIHAGGRVKRRVMRFADASTLRLEHDLQYYKMIYLGTHYVFIWRGDGGR